MIGIVIPAHNEERCLERCLAAVRLAASHPDLRDESVCVAVVLDHCTDASCSIVDQHARIGAGTGAGTGAGYLVETIVIEARNVGAARAAGAECLLAHGARWLASTDADTRVAPDWLVAQLSLNVDVVCGTVSVDDWSAHEDDAGLLCRHFDLHYTDVDGHRHIHGANLGVSAAAYRCAGGFAPLACSEDVALVEALERCGARFAWSAAPRVTTSARRDARARGGFGDTLLEYAASARLALLPALT